MFAIYKLVVNLEKAKTPLEVYNYCYDHKEVCFKKDDLVKRTLLKLSGFNNVPMKKFDYSKIYADMMKISNAWKTYSETDPLKAFKLTDSFKIGLAKEASCETRQFLKLNGFNVSTEFPGISPILNSGCQMQD